MANITFKLKLRNCIHGGMQQPEYLWVLHEYYQGRQTVIAYFQPVNTFCKLLTATDIANAMAEPVINITETQLPAIT